MFKCTNKLYVKVKLAGIFFIKILTNISFDKLILTIELRLVTLNYELGSIIIFETFW